MHVFFPFCLALGVLLLSLGISFDPGSIVADFLCCPDLTRKATELGHMTVIKRIQLSADDEKYRKPDRVG